MAKLYVLGRSLVKVETGWDKHSLPRRSRGGAATNRELSNSGLKIASVDLLGMWPPRTLTRILRGSKGADKAFAGFCRRSSNSAAGAQRQRLPGLSSFQSMEQLLLAQGSFAATVYAPDAR